MALTNQAPPKQTQIPGFKVEIGAFAFTGTDTSGELPVNMRLLYHIDFTAQDANTDEKCDVNETLANGVFVVPDTGTVTIRRKGTATSGLKVTYIAYGK